LLLAPESGEETRKKIGDELEKMGIKFPKTEETEVTTEPKSEI